MHWLENIDQQILLAINGFGSPWADTFFWVVSMKLVWLPLYLLIFYFFGKIYGWKSLLMFVPLAILSVGMADFISSGIIKEVVQRYRPSHHTQLGELLRFHQISEEHIYKGGQYGFVSGHATNFAAVCTWMLLLFWKKLRWFAVVGIVAFVLTAYSRMYLGVHYLSDIIGGTIVGCSVVLLVYRLLFLRWISKFTSE